MWRDTTKPWNTEILKHWNTKQLCSLIYCFQTPKQLFLWRTICSSLVSAMGRKTRYWRVKTCYSLAPSLNFSRLLWSLTPERDVWINEPLMPSSDVTANQMLIYANYFCSREKFSFCRPRVDDRRTPVARWQGSSTFCFASVLCLSSQLLN